MSHTGGNILLHLIFSTRERRPLIKPEFRSELFAYLGGVVQEMHGTALIINGTFDHVSFAPPGLASSLHFTHGLRRGLHSFAA